MHTITELKTKEGNSTGLIAVKVPKDAKDFSLGRIYDGANFQIIAFDINGSMDAISLPESEKFELLGLVTDSTIGFDAALAIPFFDKLEEFRGYPNYERFTTFEENGSITVSLLNDAGDSLRSLLAVNNLYWVNPMGANKPHNTFGTFVLYNKKSHIQAHENNKWQAYESNLLADSNLLILRKLQ